MKTFPKLYKLDNKGKIRVWWIVAFDWDLMSNLEATPPEYTQYHGVLDGKIQNASTTVKEGKNIGKSNETSAYEQCCLEAESLWTKQRDRKGYTETVPTAKPFGPMLAKSYDEHGHHIKFPCYVQPKLDGLRCIAKVENGSVTLWSRQNKQFTVLPHIEQNVVHLGDGIYDGELYLHSASFQDIVGAIKRDEKNDLTEKIQYHIYDMINDDTYEKRYVELVMRFSGKLRTSQIIRLVKTQVIRAENLDECHLEYTQDGYEGAMLRNPTGKYKINGRSADLQKYKKFMDAEFEVIGAEENKGKLSGTCVFRCKTANGGEFAVMPEGTEAQRRQYWQDWNSGKIKKGSLLTVKFFSWTTSTPKVPRFPIGIAIREDY